MPASFPPTRFQKYAWLSLWKAVKDSAGGIEVIYPGIREPIATPTEEWISIHPIAVNPDRRPRGSWAGIFLFQISCYSVLADARQDGSTDRPFEIADLIETALSRKDIDVRDYQSDNTSTQSLGVISVHEGRTAYVNERDRNLTGIPSSLGVGLPVNVHSVALTFRGYVLIH